MTRMLAAAFALAAMIPASEASATPFWFGWFGHDKPVVYRPIVTPETFYFQPAPPPMAEALPTYRHRHHTRHCGQYRHHRHCR